MRIAFIDHEYHIKTRSSIFMIDFLRLHGVVDVVYDTTFRTGGSFDIEPFVDNDYDLVVVWQMSTPAKHLSRHIRNRLVFVPMFDGAWELPESYWVDLKSTRILCFCEELHTKITALGSRSQRVQYYPEASPVDPEHTFDTLRGFFWQRTSQIDWPVILKLIGTTPFERFHFHCADDPGVAPIDRPTPAKLCACDVTISHWLERQSDFQHLLEQSNVFFASRALEGIGMSFLEAMARGQCVVAPNTSTMSEYIEHGVTGILYDLDDPRPLDFSRAAAIGAEARASVTEGHRRWQQDLNTRIPAFMFQRSKTIGTVSRDIWRSIKRIAH